jgi:SWIM zinc finger
MTYSADQVLAMAPDAAAAKAGLGQANPVRWSGCGRNERALWGECQGSSRRPYRTQAALDDGATKCSCPSRKSPCKHALGLLLLHAGGTIPPATPPGWVSEWLAARAARSAQSASRARRDRSEGPADPQAVERRAASREQKVDAGVAEMRRWLADLVRGGLGAAQSQPWDWWDQHARRMIDAQARGLAGQVRRMAAIAATAGRRIDWPDRLTDQIGSAQLLCEAWTRGDSLPTASFQALRVRLGFNVSAEDVAQSGERISDNWAVLGQRLGDDPNLRSLQQWLYGERTGAVVTYLAFAAGTQPLVPGLPAGSRTEATVALYPGTRPYRVLIAARDSHSEELGPIPGEADWDAALNRVADCLSVDPWAEVIPLAVRSVTVLPADRWLLRDTSGRALPTAGTAAVRWALLALSGGRPVDVAGEWDGFAFTPQAAALTGQPGRLLTGWQA